MANPELTIMEAVEYLESRGLHFSPQTLRAGIMQGKLPFGVGIQKAKRLTFRVYAKLVREWADERGGIEPEEVS